MIIKDLYNLDLKTVPFGDCIDRSELFTEYQNAPLIPDLTLFLQSKFPGQTIDESFDYRKLEQVSVEFYKTNPFDVPDDCKKPDIKQTPTFIILDQLKNSYDLFLTDISTNQNPEPRAEIIKDHLAKLSPKNQLSIINYMIADESLSTQLITGKMAFQHEKKRPAQFWGEPEVYIPELLPYEIVSQRLEDFKNKLIAHKNTPSKKTTKKPKKKFEDFFINNDLETLTPLKEYLIKLHNGRTGQRNLAFALHSIEEDYMRENIDRKAFFHSFLDAPNLNSVYTTLKKDLDGKNKIDYFLNSYDEKDISKKINYENIKEDVLNVLTQPTHETKNNTA